MGFPDPKIQVRIPTRDSIVAGVSRAGQGERAECVTAHVVSSPGNRKRARACNPELSLHLGPGRDGPGKKRRRN